MTARRDEVLARYDAIREAIGRVLTSAFEGCSKAEWARAGRQVASWAAPDALEEPDRARAMLLDVALFEPDRRGKRVFDRFMAGRARALSGPDRALAERMARTARFSLFRRAGRHEAAGVWLEDALPPSGRVWLVDRAAETAAVPERAVLGMRLFEAEDFHVAFGAFAVVEPGLVETAIDHARRGEPWPGRHSLAATLYGDALAGSEMPINARTAEMMEEVMERLDATPPAVLWRPGDDEGA